MFIVSGVNVFPSDIEFVTRNVQGLNGEYRINLRKEDHLTRFDVVETTSVRSFHHFTVGGDLTIEEPEVISKTIESVTCRWCGHGRSVEVITETE